MTLRELREVYSPNEKVKIVYRDPRNSLNYSCLYEGLFKWCRDPRLWERRVVIISSNFFETQTVIEVE